MSQVRRTFVKFTVQHQHRAITKQVETRDPATLELPPRAISFLFYDQLFGSITMDNGEVLAVVGSPHNFSAGYWIGRAYSHLERIDLDEEFRCLHKVKRPHSRYVRTVDGEWHAVRDNEEVFER